jgi:hypothetical protein
MDVLWRRYAGPSWWDPTKIRGNRGQWLEKRKAVVNKIRERGSKVTFVKNIQDCTYDPTDLSATTTWEKGDIILLEFGSTNRLFHARYFEVTEALLKDRIQDTIFIIDDPDLFPKVEGRFKAVWVNAENKEACEKKWPGQNIELFPVYGLQQVQEPSMNHEGKAVYYGGTSCSREKRLNKIQQTLGDKLEVYGVPKDYKTLVPLEPPKQAARADFYKRFGACINLTDNTHKALSWNTGRKFHALAAGCPIVEDTDMAGQEALRILALSPEERFQLIKKQQEVFTNAAQRCNVYRHESN